MPRLDFSIKFNSYTFNPNYYRITIYGIECNMKTDPLLLHNVYQAYKSNETAERLFQLYFKLEHTYFASHCCNHQFFAQDYPLSHQPLCIEEYSCAKTYGEVKDKVFKALKLNSKAEITQEEWDILFAYPKVIRIVKDKETLTHPEVYDKTQWYDAYANDVRYKDTKYGFKGRVCSICGHVFGERWDDDKLTEDDCEFLQSLIENYGIVEVE